MRIDASDQAPQPRDQMRASLKSAFVRASSWMFDGTAPGTTSKVRTIPIAESITKKHLQMEPLCCLSSCLVRGGCYAVVVFEIVFALATLLLVALKLYDGGRVKLWEAPEPNFNAIVTHQFFLYALAVFDALTIVMALVLTRGLMTFQRRLVRAHWRFDFVALGFNVLAFIAHIFALSSEGPETWSIDNVALVACFAAQIPLQLWAITVVKSCYDFFVLLFVFVSLAEK